jgi:hypothetical protein
MAGADKKPTILSGGNPQIPKGDGDGPVQDYIAAMPGWRSDFGSRLDALIVRTVPDVVKAVRWNTPFYGVEGQGQFMSFSATNKGVQLAFFNGTSLDPVPPKPSKVEGTRYLDLTEDDAFDEDQLASWIEQSSGLPGSAMF